MMQATNGRVRIDPVTGNAGIGNPSAGPVQEPVKTGDTLFQQFMSEADKAGITHWPTPPGGRQSEDCLTAAQRQWVGLTDEEIDQGLCRTPYAMKTAEAWREGVRWAYHQLKEKNSD
jgi:hypothetical protein